MSVTAKFFLGANSENGFKSYFKQLQEPERSLRLLILKGGPGSGKSTLIRKVAFYAQTKGNQVEFISCASDPESLDGIIDKTSGFAIIDGTAPHTEDPMLPGVKHHILYTGEMWNEEKLSENGEEIAFFSDLTGEYHSAATAYIRSASALLTENLNVSRKYTDSAKIAEFIKKVSSDFKNENKPSQEETRLLSAVTVGEIKFFEETLHLFADKVYILKDEWGGAADKIMKGIRNIAKLYGMKIIHCPCSVMNQKTDHIILPEIRLAISLENRFLSGSQGESIKAEAFYTTGIDRVVMEKRSADAEKLLSKAAGYVKTAKKTHDRLERFYVNAMNFDKSDELFQRIIKKFY